MGEQGEAGMATSGKDSRKGEDVSWRKGDKGAPEAVQQRAYAEARMTDANHCILQQCHCSDVNSQELSHVL